MQTVVVGGGALGSILAGCLATAGNDVTLLARGERARSLREGGVRLRGLRDLTVAVRVVDEPRAVREAELLVVAVKTYDTEAALAGLQHVRVRGAFSVQNGLVKNEQLATAFGGEVTLGAAADFSGEVLADGSVQFTRNEGLYVGELPRGTSARVDAIVAMLNAAGVRALGSEAIRTVEWSKFGAWASLTPLAVLTRLVTHRILLDPNLAYLQVRLMGEVAALAGSLDIPLEDLLAMAPAKTLSELNLDDAIAYARRYGEALEADGLTNHKMSALQDFEHGRPLEIEETLGEALRLAHDLEVAMPTIETAYRLLAAVNPGR